ncbi:pyrroloquinoline quinone biosynthesis peptide chaperone PqqD [Halomonas sp. MCCC 1A17488]|uniref:PqqA binding protein n=1 Tax=Billgrantia sulfidoxydans TaxID=2733484 RepID=A0ABX7W795_9GAMM|nr:MULTISPECIES: pyrroloquinoline quinone biosynthesis peptide chaperone PqqD [Halomonas]MCE8017516.1 pyrroloquinoline quinone biosynthesis peptide chaperone PqqD [Halomonas sp. MCCC 1A17488]MCG3240849.1 pyrroloquinoline quinone biosynthesis peptide chaperone PqqD [Halomonas sp. MCCC 1A17488]QPP48726.1 pyrroloquinoline quinone biosynthesis peptide chaperone PqqD [Halomonas sp. SS10-MC5]QTP56065.1 pyrroloquinoline quinone biosynthesis peptide chaperone PqqD [Halomonas sulfidoxydans]
MNACSVPALRRGWRLQWEAAQGRHVLLYPEGMVQLNDSAGAILSLVDGERDIAEVIDELSRRYPEGAGGELAQDVIEFFDEALRQGWIEYD